MLRIIKLVRAGKLNRSIEKRLSILNHFNYSVYFLPGENNRNDYKEFRAGEKASKTSRHPIITHLGNSSSPIKKEKTIHPMGAGENHCHLPRKAI
ncbi:MAG TPA: hypothetical protein PLQ69_01085 [Paludibacter sp.]|nr:hypothetical protein [Paludibacter sp.]